MESYKTEAVTAHGGFFFLYFSGKRDLILEITLRGVAFWEQVDGSSWGGGVLPPPFPHRQPWSDPGTGGHGMGGPRRSRGRLCMYAFCTEYLLQVNIILHPTVVCLFAKALTHLPWASAKPGFVKHLQIGNTGWAKPWCPTASGASWDSATPHPVPCVPPTLRSQGGSQPSLCLLPAPRIPPQWPPLTPISLGTPPQLQPLHRNPLLDQGYPELPPNTPPPKDRTPPHTGIQVWGSHGAAQNPPPAPKSP